MSKRPIHLTTVGNDGITKAVQSIRMAEALLGEKADDGNIRDVLAVHSVPVTDANVAAVRALTDGEA